MKLVLILLLGFLLDLIFGDPHWLYHPVRFIGKMIETGEKLLRPRFPKTPGGERAAGTVLAVVVVLLSFLLPLCLLWLLGLIHPACAFIAEVFFCYQILAVKSLKTESMKVYAALKAGNLPDARKALSWIVGRDTENLSEEKVAKAAVETVAENTSDGVVAPLLFLAVGGAPLGFLYKAINTLDSMIGYKNDKYLYFGRFGAKLDDAANFIPARITALLTILSAFLLGYDGKAAFRIWKRDRLSHTSPNSAQSEAAVAGALGLCLGGDNFYSGKLVHKPTIGDEIRLAEPEDIKRANRLLYMTAALSLLLFAGLRAGIAALFL